MFRRIVELFYPKELKEIIADLCAKDDLNEAALKILNKNINLALIFWALIVWAAYLGKSYTVFSILLIALPVIFWSSYKRWFEHYMRPYIKGKKATGVVSDIKYYRHSIEYYFNVERKTYKMPKISCWQKVTRPQIGDSMTVYLDPIREGYVMPNLTDLKRFFHLKKSQLGG